MPPISVMIKPASGNCNMKCDYCFYCDEQTKREQISYGMMSEKTLKNIIRKVILHADESCLLSFQGGEPSLAGLDFFLKAVEYVNHYNRKNISIQYAFQTNGTNITEEWCTFFKENNFLVGISIDGTEEIHNCFRKFRNGEQTYKKILKSCKLMNQYQVEYNILTVVHKKTAEDIKKIYDYYKNQEWKYQQYIACMDPLYEEQGNQSYSLTPAMYGQFLSDLFECWYKDYKKGTQPYIRQFENYVRILIGLMPEACEQQGICGVQYVAEADGSVYPCDFYMLDEYRLGNFNNNSISQMDEKRHLIRFQEISRKISEDCKSCQYIRLCRNGCHRNRILQQDGTYKNYFCDGYRFFFDKHLPQLEDIAKYVSSSY
ncbi:MAG: anaerobic sulfatase maturase [Lachnospiraceae bacterium]